MKIGPKYKIARRLGVPVFEKTQTQKYALSQQRKEKTARRSFSRPKSNYGIQLLEKQKARYTYCLSEKQFSKYAKNALERKDSQATKHFFEGLETRLDNTVYRAGFAPTRLAARQMVSHGHITVDGRRVTIPSFTVKKGNVVSIREQSLSKPLFNDFEERMQTVQSPSWIAYDAKKKEATVQGVPTFEGVELMFDLNVILEFYSR